jgi:hypothetical protein
MSHDPLPEDRIPLDELASAVGDACRAMWTIYRLKGQEWCDVARAPSEAIKDAIDTAYRLGRQRAEKIQERDEERDD